MRYISLFIGGILALSACNEVKFTGNGSEAGGVLTAGFRDSLVTVFENAGTGNTVAIDFSRELNQETRVRVAVAAEENMQEGTDYLITAKELDVAAGAASAAIEYALIDDNTANDSRSFTLKLMAVNGGVIDEGRASVRVKVLDDESDVAVGFGSTAMTVDEHETGEAYRCEIPVELFGTWRKALQFKVAVLPTEGENAAVEGVHFRLLQDVFVVENATDPISVPVEIIDDGEVNADRVFTLDISEVTGGEIYTQSKRCIVTIKNDDMGIYFGKTALEAEERAGTVKIPVRLTGVTDEPLSFTVACTGSAAEGTDYSMEKTWTIEAGQDSTEIEVNLTDRDGLSADRVLELAFGQLPENVQVYGRGTGCTLDILDCGSTVTLVGETSRMILNDSTRMVLPVSMSAAVAHDVVLTAAVTAREGLDERQVTVVNPQITIPAGSTTAQVELSLFSLPIKSKASFRLEITGAYGATAAGDACTVSKYYKYRTTDLSVTDFTSEEATGEGAGNGRAANAIDGNTGTFWHSIWAGGNPVLPEGMVLSLPDNIVVMGVEITRRIHASNADLKEVQIYLSDSQTKFLREDNGAWGTSVGSLTWTNQGSTSAEPNTRRLLLDTPLEGKKYLKVSATQSWRNSNVSIAEIAVYGYTK